MRQPRGHAMAYRVLASPSPLVPRRLDKWLRDSTTLTVVEVRKAIAEGRADWSEMGVVRTTNDPAQMVFGEDDVRLDGRRVVPREDGHSTIVFHKPIHVTVTTRDPTGKRDLSSWMRELPPGCMPVGRLDRKTTGALLLTTDGDLANALLQPDHETRKLYELRLAGDVDHVEPRLASFLRGVPSALGLLKADRVEIAGHAGGETLALVTLSEGKNRQIRRMCYALGLRLLHLHRRAVGPVVLDDLAPGAWRTLSADEVATLWSATGGRERVRARKIRALTRQAALAREAGTPLVRLEGWLSSQAAGRSEACSTATGSSTRTG